MFANSCYNLTTAFSVGNNTIEPAGSISGVVYTAGGVDFYEGMIVRAYELGSGLERGVDMSAASGAYQIDQQLLSGNPYIVAPILDAEDVSNPVNIVVSVTKGGNDIDNDFEITSAWGYISGVIEESGEPITTGIIVVASTYTFSNPDEPPDMFSGQEGIYGGITFSDGIYEVKVRVGTTYNVYAWYTNIASFSAGTTSTAVKFSLGETLSGNPPSAVVDFDFT